ncbi:MAG: hypothetical protein RLZZ426_402 [Actinomycetota bacterium]|jgi:1,4-dihydroxy-2-naphthoate octaprenyltransferase
MTSAKDWYEGARPRTLPAAIAPVLIGSSIAFWENAFNALSALLALIVALALQVGVNYANDYSDGIRGTDEVRVGPVRLVGQKLAAPTAVKKAATLSFGVALLAGGILTLTTQQLIFIPIGILAVVSAWFYTGGPNPYGYLGLGEIFVFVWFGLVAVIGTAFAQTGQLTTLSIVLGVGSGGFACALLVINNLRDIPGDTKVGKRTLAVKLGDARTRILYVTLIWIGLGSSLAVCAAAIVYPQSGLPIWIGGSVLAAAVAHVPGRAVINGVVGRDLIAVLAGTGRAQMVWSILVASALVAEASFR